MCSLRGTLEDRGCFRLGLVVSPTHGLVSNDGLLDLTIRCLLVRLLLHLDKLFLAVLKGEKRFLALRLRHADSEKLFAFIRHDRSIVQILLRHGR